MPDVSDSEGLYYHIVKTGTERPQGRLRVHELTSMFGVQEPALWEILLRMEQRRLITLSRWDGVRDRPLARWPSTEAFTNCHEDNDDVRVITRAEGLDFLCDGRSEGAAT